MLNLQIECDLSRLYTGPPRVNKDPSRYLAPPLPEVRCAVVNVSHIEIPFVQGRGVHRRHATGVVVDDEVVWLDPTVH